MDILVGGESIIQPFWGHHYTGDTLQRFVKCLPRDFDGGFYGSFSDDDFEIIPVNEIANYPYVKVNACFDDEFQGVNDQAISLLPFTVRSKSAETPAVLMNQQPSYVSIYEGETQVIFQLKNFMPKNARQIAFKYLTSVIEKVEFHLNADYTDVVINPFCREVKSCVFYPGVYSLSEIEGMIKIKRSIESLRAAQAEAGRESARKRGEVSLARIMKAITVLEREGRNVSQANVSRLTGLSKKTVQKHWKAARMDLP